MRLALLAFVLIGTLIGFALPNGKSRAVAPARVVASDALVATTGSPRPATPIVSDSPRETVIDRGDNGHFTTVAEVNGEPIRFVVDTGATTVALTQEDARRAGVSFDSGRFEVIGKGASGDVRGQDVLLRDVVLEGKRVDDVHAVVLDGLGVSLLGQNYLRHLDTVSISGDRMTLK
jgi:aspartyl protease family protein